MIYKYSDLEKAYKILSDLVKKEKNLGTMDKTIMDDHIEVLENVILPELDLIVNYDPTP